MERELTEFEMKRALARSLARRQEKEPELLPPELRQWLELLA